MAKRRSKRIEAIEIPYRARNLLLTARWESLFTEIKAIPRSEELRLRQIFFVGALSALEELILQPERLPTLMEEASQVLGLLPTGEPTVTQDVH